MSTTQTPNLLEQFMYNHEHLSTEERASFLDSLSEPDKQDYMDHGLIWLADTYPDLFTIASVRVLEKAGRASVDKAGNVSLFGDLSAYGDSFTTLYKVALKDREKRQSAIEEL